MIYLISETNIEILSQISMVFVVGRNLASIVLNVYVYLK